MNSTEATGSVVARNFAALVSGEALARLIAFGGTVYLARTLGAEFYGIIGFALAVLLYLSRIADGGMEFFGLGIREIAEDRGRVTTHAPDLITARIVISAVMAAALVVIGVLLPQQPDGLILGLYGLTLLAIGAGTRWVHLGLERTRSVAVARALGEAFALMLVVSLVRDAGDLVRVPFAQLAGDALAATVLAWALRRQGFAFPLRLHLDRVLPIFRRSAPLVLSALLGLIIYNSDLILLRFFRDAAHVGYYAAAYTLISFMINLGGTYTQSLTPTLTRVAGGATARTSLYHSSTAQVFAIALPLAAGGAFLAGDIVRLIFGAEYQAASGLALQLLLWSVPLALLREVNIVALVVNGHQMKVLRMTAISAALNLGINFLLIPRFGIAGAATSTVITEAFRLALALSYARGAGFSLATARRFWRATVASAVMLAVLTVLRPVPLGLSIGLGALSYGAVLVMVGGLRVRGRQLPVLTV